MRGQIKQGRQPVSRLNSQQANRAEDRMGHTNMAAFQLPTTYPGAGAPEGAGARKMVRKGRNPEAGAHQ